MTGPWREPSTYAFPVNNENKLLSATCPHVKTRMHPKLEQKAKLTLRMPRRYTIVMMKQRPRKKFKFFFQ